MLEKDKLNEAERDQITMSMKVDVKNNESQNSYELNENNLKDAIKDFRESVKNKKSEEAVLKRKISLKNGAISLTLENELELSIFEDLKNKLHGFLKKKFNKNIEIVTSVTIKKKEKTIYTNKDKFEYLSKQNSNLEELKNKLGLDYEY